MKHNHVTTCEHEIKVCDCCDTAYCSKCDKEWGTAKTCALPHYPTYIPYYPQPVIPARPLWYWQQPYVTVGGNTWQGTNTITNAGGWSTNTNSMLQLSNSTGSNQQ